MKDAEYLKEAERLTMLSDEEFKAALLKLHPEITVSTDEHGQEIFHGIGLKKTSPRRDT